MKRLLLLGLLVFVLLSARSNTYYSVNNANPNSTGSWHINRNGTGATPSNFNGGDIFIIQAGHTITTTANWSLGGTNSKIIIENGAILKANHMITVRIFQADAGGKYIHNDNSSAFPGTNSRVLAATSTVEINDWSGSSQLPWPTTWGNLVIDMPSYNSNINQSGRLTNIAGDFIVRSTGSFGKEFRLSDNEDYTLTIGGDFIIEGGILDASQSYGNADQAIIINGSFIQTGGFFLRSNSNSNTLKIQFNGTNSHFSQTGGILFGIYIDWQINSSKKLTLDTDFPISLFRELTVNGTLDCSVHQVSGFGSFTANNNGLIITSHTQGLIGSLGISGLLSLNSGVSYEFLSPTTTPFPAILSSVSARNLTLGADVTLNKDLTISGTLTINNGKLIIPSGNSVTISSGNAIAGSAFDATKRIVTQVNYSTGTKSYIRLQNFTGTRTIPVGDDNYYLPVTLTVSGSNDFSICAFRGMTVNGQPNGTAFTSTQKKSIVDAVWQVNRNSGTGGVMMQLGWPDALEGSQFQTLGNSQIGIAHYGTAWETAFGSGNQALNTATRPAIVSFSPFGVGMASVPLPLKLGDLNAAQQGNGIRLSWYAFSEINLDHYTVERSTDGRNFTGIGNVQANGRIERSDYSWLDNSAGERTFFYRIRGVDKDGQSIYSAVVKISNISRSSVGLMIYPNPLTERRVTLQINSLPEGIYDVNVYDPGGRNIYHKDFDHSGGSISQQFELPADLPAGLYTLSVINGKGIKLVKTLIMK